MGSGFPGSWPSETWLLVGRLPVGWRWLRSGRRCGGRNRAMAPSRQQRVWGWFCGRCPWTTSSCCCRHAKPTRRSSCSANLWRSLWASSGMWRTSGCCCRWCLVWTDGGSLGFGLVAELVCDVVALASGVTAAVDPWEPLAVGQDTSSLPYCGSVYLPVG